MISHKTMKNRTLYFGDNLEILRKKISDETFDLIYLDPPFNSNRNYNVLFKEGLQDSPAQVQAFEDSWHWAEESKHTFDYLVTKSTGDISNLMQALEKMIGHNDMMAYLTMMTVRLIELHRVLKKTGSLYLHCDPTASHYLKVVLDAIFGKQNFCNEIVWKRSQSRSSISKIFRRAHDVILFYSNSSDYNFNIQFKELSEASKKLYEKEDEKGYFQAVPLLVSGRRNGETGKVWRNIDPNKQGKDGMHWVTTPDKLEEYDKQSLILWPKKEGGLPRLKYYLDNSPGVPMNDFWDDIDLIASSSSESLGYPTQKPEALLERIIKASSKEGDSILDPFCGCGTTVSVAERLKRNWVGIDITTLAINLIKRRLRDQFGLGVKQIITDGLPTDLAAAKEMFAKDAFQFEYWALDLINAMPGPGKSKENMKGADKGIDGIINFYKGAINGKEEYGKAIVQVKGGGAHRNDIATLKGDIEREKANCGILITLEPPTKPMIQEAIDAGSFEITFGNKFEFPKIQILTIEELLKGKQPNLPYGLAKNYHKEAKAVEEDNGAIQGGFKI